MRQYNFTISGIANEFVKHRDNALVVDYMNAEQIYDAVMEILSSPLEAGKRAENAYEQVLEIFDVTGMINETIRNYGK